MLGRYNTVPFKTPSLQFKMLDSGPNLHLHNKNTKNNNTVFVNIILSVGLTRDRKP